MSPEKDVITKFYERVAVSTKISDLKLPLSTVFYVREALFQHTQIYYPLDHVTISMWLEGMLPLEEVKEIPQWYVDKYMGGSHDFVALKESIRRKKLLTSAFE